MFGDLMGMMGQIKDAQKNAEEAKEKLNHVIVSGDAAGGAVRISATANKEIKDIEIADALMQDKEELIDVLVIAINNTLKKAEAVHNAEMKSAVKDHMPNIPGMNF